MAHQRLLERVELFYKLARFGLRGDYLKSLGQEASMSGQVPIPGSPGTPGGRPLSFDEKVRQMTGGRAVSTPATTPAPQTQTLPEMKIEGYPPINPATQKQLSEVLIAAGLMSPPGLNPDGQVGPLTQAAMKAFTNKFKVPATPAMIASTHANLKAHPEMASMPADIELA